MSHFPTPDCDQAQTWNAGCDDQEVEVQNFVHHHLLHTKQRAAMQSEREHEHDDKVEADDEVIDAQDIAEVVDDEGDHEPMDDEDDGDDAMMEGDGEGGEGMEMDAEEQLQDNSIASTCECPPAP